MNASLVVTPLVSAKEQMRSSSLKVARPGDTLNEKRNVMVTKSSLEVGDTMNGKLDDGRISCILKLIHMEVKSTLWTTT
ncbi:unnamed protein product [Trichobilharzia szidati]|nr:unnamed protein product [Trichobilharzia szidati]